MAVVLFTLPLIGSVTLGDAIAVLGTIASFLLRPHPQTPTFHAMASAWGKTWPKTYNSCRVAGNVIQAGDVTKHDKKKGPPKFSQSFAIGFCAGPRQILRIWADNQVIYDIRPLNPPQQWQANTNYGAGDVVVPTSTDSFYMTATVDGLSGATEPAWTLAANGITRDNQEVWTAAKKPKKPRKLGKQYKFNMTAYLGDETQMPDSTLEAMVGSGNQSAYRGLVYCVFENFDLSKYGNRIPNLEAEVVNFSVPIPFYEDQSGPPGVNGLAFEDMVAAPGATVGYAFVDEQTVPITNAIISFTLAKVSLTSANVLQKSDPISASNLGNDISNETVGVIAWDVPTVLWRGSGPNGGPTSFDLTTMSNIPTAAYTWPGAPTYNNPNYPYAINRSGTTMVGSGWKFGGAGDNVLQAVNLTSGSSTVALCSGIGGPPDRSTAALWIPIFDDNGHVWVMDNHGHLWRTTVTQSGSGAPIMSSMTSFNLNSYGSFSFYGEMIFNPDTKYLTIFLYDNGAGNMRAIDFDTVGLTVIGTHLADDGSGQFQNADQRGWTNKRYLSSVGGTHSGFPNTVGIYDRQMGTFSLTDWSFWNLPDPGFGDSPGLFTAIASQDGGSVVASKYSTSFNLEGDVFWYFPFKSGGLTLADIIADISNEVGLDSSLYDYTQLEQVVPRGVVLNDRMPARQFVESMMPAFFFDLTDIGDKVVGTLRSLSTVSQVISEDDLAAVANGGEIIDKISIERNDDLEIPRDLALSYFDYQHDYQGGTTPSIRLPITNYSSGRNTVTVPVVLTPNEAADAVARLLYMMWIERNNIKVSLGIEKIAITPADVIDAIRNGQTHRMRVTRATLNPMLVLDVEALSEDLGTYSITAAATIADISTGSFNSGQINPVVTAALAVLDTAALQQADLQDPGVYVAVTPSVPDSAFDLVTVQESVDDATFTNVTSVNTESVMGSCTTTLPNFTDFPNWDRTSTLTVSLLFGQLASASEASLIANFTNLIWLSNGEIVQAATATLISGTGGESDPLVYQLSDFLRGRFGTEAFIGTHAANETFVVLDPTTMGIVNYSPSELDAVRYWQAANDADTNPISPTQTLTMTTRRLMPFAPYYLKGARDMSNNLTITGLRRMRWRGTPLWTPPETDLPVTMEIDILNGVTVVRTLTATLSGSGSGITDASAFTAYYSAADQTTDFGSPQAAVSIKAYQLNAVRGRGYAGSKTV